MLNNKKNKKQAPRARAKTRALPFISNYQSLYNKTSKNKKDRLMLPSSDLPFTSLYERE